MAMAEPPTGPLFFPGATRTERRALAQLKSEGRVRPIGPRLYALSQLSARDTESRVSSHWAQIVSALFPHALISHRTALEYRPVDGDVFLTGKTNRVVEYPGLRLRFQRGPEPLDDDPKFLGIRASSLPRAFLENLSTQRGAEKNVPIEVLEARLEQVLRDAGERGLNAIRDRAREIAERFSWRKEMTKLDALIGALLGTRPGSHVTSALARARVIGEPFDERCVERLQALFAELRGRALTDQADRFGYGDHFRNKAFFEAYFSNFIEGTTFELQEAEKIVFDREIPEQRPQDAHDIDGTYRIVSDPNEMRRTPREYHELVHLLVERHRTLMSWRPEIAPGQFKQTINRAGDTMFVHPDYVIGTLKRGADLLVDLAAGLPRAIFVMFLVADVHPFNDGNGRMARIMMNAELVAASSTTIIVPTAYRDEYIDTLRALTRQHRPAPVVDMLVRAQRFSALDFSDYPRIKKELEDRNWFKEPGTFKLVM
jgi:hypothetical protein